MKLLFENWRKHLKEIAEPDAHAKTKVAKPKNKPEADAYGAPYEYEHESPKAYSREQFFGKNPDELQCVIDLRSPADMNPMDFYRCMARHGYNKIDAGSFRAVFTMPGNSDMVLKIVGPANSRFSDKKRSMEMNKKEAEGAFQTSSELVPKVFDSARDYFWIISEKVVPIRTWREMQAFFPAWQKEDRDEFSWWFQQIIAADVDKKSKDIIRLLNIREKGGLGEKLINDPLILQIRDLLAQFGLPAWDIRPHNVGYANRNGKKQFVILDPGFELGKDAGTVAQDTSTGAPKNIMDIFKDDAVQTWQPEKEKSNKTTGIVENWRHLIKESRGPKDFYYQITQSSKKITIEPLNLQTKEPESGKAEGSAEVILEKRTDIPYWQLAWSNSPQGTEGVGTIMYLMALELAGNEGLSPDDYSQSDDALRVWTKFMSEKNRFGVSKQKKEEFAHDNDENPFFFVFFKPQSTILSRFSKQVSYEQGQEEEKPNFDAHVEPFNTEDWDSLYDDDILQEEEPFQKKVKAKHRKMKIRLIGKGKNKHNVGKKMKKPSYKRSKSAPPGAGGT